MDNKTVQILPVAFFLFIFISSIFLFILLNRWNYKNKINSVFGVLIIILLMLISSCKPEYYNKKNIDILTSHKWIVNTYVDNSQNITLDTQPIIYSFHKNGTLEKEYDTGFIATATWHLSEDNQYLRMGNNIFKLQTLTNRLLAVRYGDVDMFFVSIKE